MLAGASLLFVACSVLFSLVVWFEACCGCFAALLGLLFDVLRICMGIPQGCLELFGFVVSGFGNVCLSVLRHFFCLAPWVLIVPRVSLFFRIQGDMRLFCRVWLLGFFAVSYCTLLESAPVARNCSCCGELRSLCSLTVWQKSRAFTQFIDARPKTAPVCKACVSSRIAVLPKNIRLGVGPTTNTPNQDPGSISWVSLVVYCFFLKSRVASRGFSVSFRFLCEGLSFMKSVAQSRPFDLLVSPFWSSFSHCPKRSTFYFWVLWASELIVAVPSFLASRFLICSFP